jgi:CspA family cold shock protein
MPIGKLKMWNAARGFGFIQNEDGGPDVFLHIIALQNAGIDPDSTPAERTAGRIRDQAGPSSGRAEGEGEIARMEKLVALAFVFVIVAFVGVYALAAWKGQGKGK